MDPASEIDARECFSKRDQQAVGWYHSHPTFAPNPSVRDITNQTSYQVIIKCSDYLDFTMCLMAYNRRTF